MTSVYDKVQNACHRLNAEAYEAQFIANGKRPLKQFTPCAKAVELLKALQPGKHFGMQEAIAARTVCGCHNGLSHDELMSYEYDDTYRKANENHDHKILYPRLFRREA